MQTPYKSLMEIMMEGMVVQNKDGYVIDFNPAALEILGLTSQQLTGKTFYDSDWKAVREDGSDFPGDDHPAMVVLRTGKIQKNVIMGVRHSSGKLRWILINAVPVFKENDSTPDQVLSTFSDITKIKEQETILRQASKMSALGEMAGGLSHEINNPLAIIAGYAGLLRSQFSGNLSKVDLVKTREKPVNIEKTVERITKVIRSLRVFSNSSENDPKINVPFSKIIDEALILCQERLKNKSIKLTIENPENPTLFVRPSQISQVLLNLLNNSHDALVNHEIKWVRIRTESDERHFRFSVLDSGPEIPANVQQKMLHPFFTTKEIGKGIGMGLSTSKGIIESHGGRLFFDSSQPHTCFTVELPIEKKNK